MFCGAEKKNEKRGSIHTTAGRNDLRYKKVSGYQTKLSCTKKRKEEFAKRIAHYY